MFSLQMLIFFHACLSATSRARKKREQKRNVYDVVQSKRTNNIISLLLFTNNIIFKLYIIMKKLIHIYLIIIFITKNTILKMYMYINGNFICNSVFFVVSQIPFVGSKFQKQVICAQNNLLSSRDVWEGLRTIVKNILLSTNLGARVTGT